GGMHAFTSFAIEDADVAGYYSFLDHFYREIEEQAFLLFHDIHGEKDILWHFTRNGAYRWHLPTSDVKMALNIRRRLERDLFDEKVLPCLNESTSLELVVFDRLTAKGGASMDAEENALFKKHWRLSLEEM